MVVRLLKYPITLVFLCGLFMGMINVIGVQYRMLFSNQITTAILLFLSGLMVILIAGYTFKKAKTTVNPATPYAASSLVTTGIFSFSRNPMYVGFLLILSAFWLFSDNLLNALFLFFFVILANRLYILPEEKALEKLFSDEFVTYKAKVRRWL